MICLLRHRDAADFATAFRIEQAELDFFAVL
jgi:hypothetical protein